MKMKRKERGFMWLWLEAKYLCGKTEWQTGRMDRLENRLADIRDELENQKYRLCILEENIRSTLKEEKKK